MGFFGDLAMGFGLKDRDASYYDRTAATIGRTQGADREALYRQSRAYTEQPTRGGPVAMLGSAIDRRREGQSQGGWGYGEGDARVSALRDMLDGGGRGRAGQQFEGGLLADLANALGLRPLGYEDRLAAAQQQPSQKRAAKASGPDWKNPVAGMSIDGQGARFGEIGQSLSFGGQPLPQYPTSSPLAFGGPRPEPSFVDTRINTQLYGDPLGSGQFVNNSSVPLDMYQILRGIGYTAPQANTSLTRLFGRHPRGRG